MAKLTCRGQFDYLSCKWHGTRRFVALTSLSQHRCIRKCFHWPILARLKPVAFCALLSLLEGAGGLVFSLRSTDLCPACFPSLCTAPAFAALSQSSFMAFSFVVAPSERFSMAEVVGGDGQPCSSLWIRKFEATGLQAAKSDCPEAARGSPLVEAVPGEGSVDLSGKTRHCTPLLHEAVHCSGRLRETEAHSVSVGFQARSSTPSEVCSKRCCKPAQGHQEAPREEREQNKKLRKSAGAF